MPNSKSQAGTKAQQRTKAEVTPSGSHNAKPLVGHSLSNVKFYFFIDFNSPNYEEEYFYGKTNTKQLNHLCKSFYKQGIVFSKGDIIDVVGLDKDADSVRFEITKRCFLNNAISFSLAYTDK